MRKKAGLPASGVFFALTIEEAAAAARIGVNTIMKAITSGALPAKKNGTRTLIRPAALEQYLDSLPDHESLPVIKARNAAAAGAGAPICADLDLEPAPKPTHDGPPRRSLAAVD